MASYHGYTGVRLPWREDCILVSSRGHNNNSVVSSVSLIVLVTVLRRIARDEGVTLIGQQLLPNASNWLEIGVNGMFYSCLTLKQELFFPPTSQLRC